jgi:hypothetical protein
MAEIGQATGRIAGSMPAREDIARVVHAASKRVYLGPLVEADGEFVVTSQCRGNPKHITVEGVVCGFDDVSVVPGITKVRRCDNCPRG